MRRLAGYEWVRVQKQTVEGNDPHGGHGQVCKGERASVGVRRGMAEAKYCVLGGCLPFACVKEVSKICLMSGHLLC